MRLAGGHCRNGKSPFRALTQVSTDCAVNSSFLVEMERARSGRCIASPSDIQGGEEHRSRTRYKIHLRKRYDYEPGTYYHDGEVESSGAQD